MNNPLLVNPDNIWSYEQNKVSLIAKDFQRLGIPKVVTYYILMARGVFKWFAVRRDLIKLKNIWKDRITETIKEIKIAKMNKNYKRQVELRGRIKAYEECRKEIRALCHSERWRCPDNEFGIMRLLR